MDVSFIATAYAAFGGVLVGFAFTGLLIYVTRSPEPDTGDNAVDVLITRGGRFWIRLIPVSAVAATGFYAMTSLGISTFLYANLAGESSAARKGQAQTALLVYGVVFALSVLTLFYFVTLMLFERPLTKPAAKPAFWAGTIAGSIVVLRFVAGSAQAARLTRCSKGHPCHPGLLYTTHGITSALIFTALVFVVITLTRVLETRLLRRLFTLFAGRPAIPSAGVFFTAVAVAALASLYINTRAEGYVPPGWLILASYATGIVLIILFALASGSVIYPRVHSTRLTRLPAPAGTQRIKWMPWWDHVKARNAESNEIVHPKYSEGIRPDVHRQLIWQVLAVHRQLIWQVPARAGTGKLITQFRVRPDKPWRIGGWLVLVAGITNAPAGSPCIKVTLTIGSDDDGRKVDMKVSAGKEPILLDGAERRPYDRLRVEVERLDSSPEDVLLCWLEAGVTIVRLSSEGVSPVGTSVRGEQQGTE